MAADQWAKDIDVGCRVFSNETPEPSNILGVLLELRGADAQRCPGKPKDAFNPSDALSVCMDPRFTSELNGLYPSKVQIGKIPAIISVTSIVEEISHVNSMCTIVYSLKDLLSGFSSALNYRNGCFWRIRSCVFRLEESLQMQARNK